MGIAAVLRPEPGNARTAARLTAMGVTVRRLPLFAYRALAWEPPDPAAYDALLLSSAAAVRLAGNGLARLAGLPVAAVGAATARAARAVGLTVEVVGESGAADAIARARAAGLRRLLHLSGRDRAPCPKDGPPSPAPDTPAPSTPAPQVLALPVYAADPLPLPPGSLSALHGGVALLHSPRAATRLAEAVREQGADGGRIAVVALSSAVLAAAGPGWRAGVAAAMPRDEALCRLAASLLARAD